MGFLDISNWNDSNDLHSWQLTLSISHGTYVYSSVRCFNKVGFYKTVHRKQPLIISFIPPKPLSEDVNFAIHSATIQKTINVQSFATSLHFHWPMFQDLSKLSSYIVCIKTVFLYAKCITFINFNKIHMDDEFVILDCFYFSYSSNKF